MQTLKPVITLDIWSDLVCPWCWIAKKRFEKGLAAFEHRDSVVIRHHAFRISGERPALPFREALYKKFGGQHGAELMMNQGQRPVSRKAFSTILTPCCLAILKMR